MTRPAEERFLEKIDRSGDCWLWTAALYKGSGYAVFRPSSSRHARAHRWSYEHFIGPIPDGMHVCHRCDVRHCVRPEHLFLGTAADNQADMTQKGRGRVGQRNGGYLKPHKLSANDAARIRQLYERGGMSQQSIADAFGVTQTMISMIVRGVRWAC